MRAVGTRVGRGTAVVRQRLAPAGPPLRRTFSAVTPLGWVALAAGLTLLVLARWQGWRELAVAGIALLVLWVLAVAWTLGRTSYRVDLELVKQRVAINESAVGRVEVTATRAMPPAWVELAVGAGAAGFEVPLLTKGASHEEIFTIPTRRRAVITVGPVRSVRGDALGLMRREQDWTQAIELFVHPDTVALGSAVTGFLKDVDGVTTSDLSSSDVSFHALRDYVPGDDRRSIHWKSTARTGRLMVRQFEENRRAHLLVLLSLREEDYADPADVETAISVAASLARQALTDGRQVDVVTQHGAVRFGAAPRLLDELCRVQAEPGLPGTDHLVGLGTALAPQASVVAVVTGAHGDIAELRRAQRHIPLSALSFCVRADRGRFERRQLGTMTVFTLGGLDDLPRALKVIAP